MKRSVITLIAAASLAVPVIALAQQGSAHSITPTANVRQEDRAQAQPGDDHGQVQGVGHDANDIDVNDNDANENQAEEANEAKATPSPAATPAVEDRMNGRDSSGDNDATEVHSSGRGSNSGHDGSDD